MNNLVRRVKRLWARLHELHNRKNITRDDLLMHRGALKKEAGRDFGLVRISIPNPREPVNENTFHFSLDRERLRQTLRREGRYLLRSKPIFLFPFWLFVSTRRCEILHGDEPQG